MANVLIIESEEIAEILKFILQEEGHVTNVVNGIKDIAEIEKLNPDVVFVHQRNTSGLQGHVLISMIKNFPATSHIKTILTSTRHDVKLLANEAGSDGYISKPFNIDEVLAVMKSVLS